MTWCSGFEDICKADAPLAELTWYKLGGPARWLCEPRDAEELSLALARADDAGLRWRVLGRGANLLVRDAGFDGVVIRLSDSAFQHVEWHDDGLSAGAGCDFPKLIRAAIARGFVGLERLAGIPGTLGGVVRMNAGGKYGEICEFVQSVTAVNPASIPDCRDVERTSEESHASSANRADRPGFSQASATLAPGEAVADRSPGLATYAAPDCGFAYRRSRFAGGVVVGGRLRLDRGDAEAALLRHREIWNEKYDTQPPVKARSAGCVFKNPPGRSAGRLIDECGLKGARVGGAEISPRHANFIVAGDGATAQHVVDLIRLVQQRVLGATGVELHTEIEIW